MTEWLEGVWFSARLHCHLLLGGADRVLRWYGRLAAVEAVNEAIESEDRDLLRELTQPGAPVDLVIGKAELPLLSVQIGGQAISVLQTEVRQVLTTERHRMLVALAELDDERMMVSSGR